MSWSFDVGPNPLPPGHVTGDFITMLAVAWSLVRQQQADAFDMLDCLASSYSPGSAARYSPYNALALEGLTEGEGDSTHACYISQVHIASMGV
jgi:hypothetical protein